MSVFDLAVGESATIKSVKLPVGAAARLASLGVITDKKVTVLAFSLFKSSVLIGCGAVRLGMRRAMAKGVEVEKCE